MGQDSCRYRAQGGGPLPPAGSAPALTGERLAPQSRAQTCSAASIDCGQQGEEPPIDFDGAVNALPLARWQEEVYTGQRHASNFRGLFPPARAEANQLRASPSSRRRRRRPRILTEDRELLRALTLDPTHSYQLSEAVGQPTMSCNRCQHVLRHDSGWGGRIRTLDLLIQSHKP